MAGPPPSPTRPDPMAGRVEVPRHARVAAVEREYHDGQGPAAGDARADIKKLLCRWRRVASLVTVGMWGSGGGRAMAKNLVAVVPTDTQIAVVVTLWAVPVVLGIRWAARTLMGPLPEPLRPANVGQHPRAALENDTHDAAAAERRPT